MLSVKSISIVIFFSVALPVASAWHAFVPRYLFASLLAAANIIVLLLLLVILNGQLGHYLGSMLLAGFGASLLVSLLVGLPFRMHRNKGIKQKALS